MDIEKITQAGSYSAPKSEPVKVNTSNTDAALEKADVVTEVAAPEVTQSGMTGGEDNKKGNEEKKEHQASEASIGDAVSRANRKMEHTRCEYSYHKETKRVSIKVIDDVTDKVIREIPPEKSLDMLQKMWEMAGILVDEKR